MAFIEQGQAAGYARPSDRVIVKRDASLDSLRELKDIHMVIPGSSRLAVAQWHNNDTSLSTMTWILDI